MKKLTYWLILSGLLLITSCVVKTNEVPPTILPSSAVTLSYEPLSTSTVERLMQISEFSIANNSVPVGAVYYALESDYVYAVYPQKGDLIGWDAQTGSIGISHHLGIVSSKALQFSKSGEILMGATGTVHKLYSGQQQTEYVGGIALWNTQSGNLVECISHPCPAPDTMKDGRLNALIDKTGQLFLGYSEGGYNLLDFSWQIPDQIVAINDPDEPYYWSISRLALDSTNSRFAMIFQEGRVDIVEITKKINRHTVIEGSEGDLQNVVSAAFDPTGQILAFIRGSHLSVWQLNSKVNLLIESEISNPITLQFDQMGKLLFIGSANKISVLDIENRKLVAQFDALELTTLTVSEDNRLLLWGDGEGKVHLMGTLIDR